jgi:type I restriction enzyme M protein
MKSGQLLRKVINVLNEADFSNHAETHAFNDVYETLLKGLQASGTHGEFYTPRALTDFVVEMTKPQLGDKVADFACGTGGMLISALEELDKQVDTVEKRTVLQNSIYGQELKPLPYLLATTNLMFHDIEVPNIIRGNSLADDVRYPKEKMDVLVMNPPYGSTSSPENKSSVPLDLQGSELSDLFMVKMMYALNENGRVGVILPDGFLFGTDNAKTNIKKKLLNEFNLHTIIRLPSGVFAPYTSITTNILFFDKTVPTEDVWYYEHKVGNGGKTYSKTKQLRSEHFNPEREWWNNRTDIDSAFKVSKEDIEKNGYNLDFKRSSIVEEVRRDVHEIMSSMTDSLMRQLKALDELKELI